MPEQTRGGFPLATSRVLRCAANGGDLNRRKMDQDVEDSLCIGRRKGLDCGFES